MPVIDPAQTRAALDKLGSSPGKDLKPRRLGAGLVPPTNRWFSGLVFGDQPQPVFSYPLSFGLEQGGFGFGLPDVQTTEKTIMGGYRPSVKVSVAGAADWKVTAYDELSITLGDRTHRVMIAQGSPYVWFSADEKTTLTTNVNFVEKDGVMVATDASGSYGLVLDKARVQGTTITLEAGGRATWFAVPTGGSAKTLAEHAAPLTGTGVSWQVAGEKVTTRLRYQTATGTSAFGALPHQRAALVDTTCDLGTYSTILGEMALCAGKELAFSTPEHPAVPTLDVSGLSEPQKDELRRQIGADIANAKPYAADTYFGGKHLHRDAQLYALAKQLGAPEAAGLMQKLTQAMDRWTNPEGCGTVSEYCFTYDATNKGIVGKVSTFGSDEFNDHHFHYGYFLYAAALLARDDPALVEKYRPVVNLLAADIASSSPSAQFPVRRNFDAYAGHSWASGTSPFADGNNQESSSEAVHAYAGLKLWAEVSGQQSLAEQATWMQSLEASTALAYYVNFDTSETVYQGYGHTISPLIFGGKRDYATWFSPEPAAALAIQVLPMSPSMAYLQTNPERIGKNLAEGLGTKGFNQPYGDVLLMYAGMQGAKQRGQALVDARKYPLAQMDDGLTRTYLLAFLMTLKH